MCTFDPQTQQFTKHNLTCDSCQGYSPRSVHVRSVVINNRFYMFQNMTTNTTGLVWVVDPCLKRVFNIKLIPTTKKDDPPNNPSTGRINYAMAEVNNKVYFYGGVDE